MSIKRMSLAAIAIVLLAGLSFSMPAQEEQEESTANKGKKFISVDVGKTGPALDSGRDPIPGQFQRVLLSPPDLEKMKPGTLWEISPEAAIKLGNLAEEERWRIIRRNLGLSQDANKDLVLWPEVINAFFDQIKALPLENGAKGPAFGLRVAFPGNDPDPTKRDEPEVALTFNSDLTFDRDTKKDFEARLKDRIKDALTGVEVFVNVAYDVKPEEEAEAPGEAAKILANLRLHLSDENGKLYTPVHIGQGCYGFPALAVDPKYPDLGSGYRLWVEVAKEYSSEKYFVETRFPEDEEQYVPVRRGVRTRRHLAVILKSKALEAEREAAEATTKFVTPFAAIEGVLRILTGTTYLSEARSLIGQSDVLTEITRHLEENPGLHLGAILVKDEGLQPLYSVRFHLRAPEQDRQPRFVSRGMFRLQCYSQANPEGTVVPKYIMIVWSGQADPSQLDLKSRPIKSFPLGMTIGLAPHLDPVLYAFGGSYKIFNIMELFAGAGVREGFPASFIYGLTLDLEKLLTVLFKR